MNKFLPHGLLFTILRGLCTGGTPQTWVPKRTTGICPFSVAIWNFKGQPMTVAFTGITTGAKSETYRKKHQYTFYTTELTTSYYLDHTFTFLKHHVKLSNLLTITSMFQKIKAAYYKKKRVISKELINLATQSHHMTKNTQTLIKQRGYSIFNWGDCFCPFNKLNTKTVLQ